MKKIPQKNHQELNLKLHINAPILNCEHFPQKGIRNMVCSSCSLILFIGHKKNRAFGCLSVVIIVDTFIILYFLYKILDPIKIKYQISDPKINKYQISRVRKNQISGLKIRYQTQKKSIIRYHTP